MLSYEGSKDVIHHSLEGSGRVGKAKEHNCGFLQAVVCFESHLMFIACLDMYIVVSPSNIQFCINVRLL